MAQAARPIPTDVLIIGGGVQGLWLLDSLCRLGYDAILLERRLLGSQQTCHSHVYLHHGLVYAAEALGTNENLIDRLHHVRGTWGAWLAGRTNIAWGHQPSYFGFNNRFRLEEQVRKWNEFGLSHMPVGSLPDIFDGGMVKAVCVSTEVTLDGRWLVQELSRGRGGSIGRIHAVEAINTGQVDPSGRPAPITVTVITREPPPTTPREEWDRRVFSARAVILTAGAGNGGLLRLACGANGQPLHGVGTVPIVRKGHMLVIRGPTDQLLPLTGVFPDVGELFLVSRQENGETVWLISNGASPDAEHPDEYLACDTCAWLPPVIRRLEQLAPRLFGTDQLSSHYSWGVYDAPKAEQGPPRTSVRAPGFWEQIPGTGLFVILPTKLTLAPLMSEEVVRQLPALEINPKGPIPPDPARKADLDGVLVAEEKWRYLPMHNWGDFRSCHMIP